MVEECRWLGEAPDDPCLDKTRRLVIPCLRRIQLDSSSSFPRSSARVEKMQAAALDSSPSTLRILHVLDDARKSESARWSKRDRAFQKDRRLRSRAARENPVDSVDWNVPGTDERYYFTHERKTAVQPAYRANAMWNPRGVIPVGVPRQAREYKMDHPRRGKALLFNQKTFQSDLDLGVRGGTDKDRDALLCVLGFLRFEIHLFEDKSLKEIKEVIDNVAAENHEQHDCLVVCFLSHGEHGLVYACDQAFQPSCLWVPFAADLCPTLAGKPKLCFIQACQGKLADEGVTLKCNLTDTDSRQEADSYRIPVFADFLIAYSTVPGTMLVHLHLTKSVDTMVLNTTGILNLLDVCVPTQASVTLLNGYYSWRNTLNGSWFVQALCEVLLDHSHEEDLMSMMTEVARRVAFDFESNLPMDAKMHRKKQVPFLTSTLTRRVFFDTVRSSVIPIPS
ncbi:unnamed protein product [Darwinula stevensoni]|uniref:Uncharacterized protein n=1 Tax=Darwinula stevensoni TaxID=69355 RepID=A0A7R8WZP1_9CRUS|nr:unnamed protein product [Darwinula stevensoni]CAG0880768.1 unnamed protein product [Darwinula stevensoni]